jgi:hypothetical protein
MNVKLAAPLALASALVSFSNASGQGVPLRGGERVRVTAPALGMDRQEALFQAVDGSTLLVAVDTTIGCPLNSVKRLEVFWWNSHYAKQGAAIGAALGIAAMVTLGPSPNRDVGAMALILAGGLSGAAVGGLVGYSIKVDKWQDVPLETLGVSVAPERLGIRIGARIGF